MRELKPFTGGAAELRAELDAARDHALRVFIASAGWNIEPGETPTQAYRRHMCGRDDAGG